MPEPNRWHRVIIYFIKYLIRSLKKKIWSLMVYLFRIFVIRPLISLLYPFACLDVLLAEMFFRDTRRELLEKRSSKHLKVLDEPYRYGIDVLNGFGPIRRGIFRFFGVNKKGFLSGKESLFL